MITLLGSAIWVRICVVFLVFDIFRRKNASQEKEIRQKETCKDDWGREASIYGAEKIGRRRNEEEKGGHVDTIFEGKSHNTLYFLFNLYISSRNSVAVILPGSHILQWLEAVAKLIMTDWIMLQISTLQIANRTDLSNTYFEEVLKT